MNHCEVCGRKDSAYCGPGYGFRCSRHLSAFEGLTENSRAQYAPEPEPALKKKIGFFKRIFFGSLK